MSDRYLLCVPRGGLNDTLCQLERCWNYARKYDRNLILHTRKSGLMSDFSEFFQLADPSVNCVTALSSETIQRLTSLYPHARSVLDSYFADGQSVGDAPGSIDFLTDASSPVLIHESPGGGGASKRFLHRIRIASELLPEIRSGLSSLPRKYVSVHIRHTDHQTDYESYLATIKEELVGKEVLVCSDNAEVITAARSVFVRSNILTVTELPSGDPRPLHLANRYANSDKMKAATTNALIDLFALGASQKIYSTNVLEGYPSGFTKLAIYLSENKYLLRTLLSGENAIDRIRSTLVPVQYQANDLLRVAKSALNLR